MSYELRPLSLAELLDRAFGIYRRQFLVFVGILALPSLVMLVFNVVLQTLQPPQPAPGAEPDTAVAMTAAVWIFAAMGLAMILYWITYAVALGASTFAVSLIYKGQAPTIAASYGSLQGKVGRLAWLLLQVFLRVVGAMLAFGLIATLLGGAAAVFSPILMAFLVVMAMAGAFGVFCWLMLRYSVAVPPAVLEDNTASASIRRSVDLTRGHLWRVLVLLVFTVIVNYAGLMLFQGPFWVAAVLTGVETSAGFWLTITGVLAGSIAAALTSPLGVVAMAVLYYDLRIRKEGFDLEVMIANLRADGSVPPTPSDATGRGLLFPN